MADSVLLGMQETDEEMVPPVEQPSNPKGWPRYHARLPLLILAFAGTMLFAASIDKPAVGARIATPGVIGKAIATGDMMPDFEATTTTGNVKLHDWMGNQWSLLIAFGKAFEPVGLSELVQMSKYSEEFGKRGVKLLALTPDSTESQTSFIGDVEQFTDNPFDIAMVGDESKDVSVTLGLMEDADRQEAPSFNTAFIVGDDKTVKTRFQYAAEVGFNFDEIIRVIDALQLTAAKKVRTPANWKLGNEVVVEPSVSADDVKDLFPMGARVEDVPSGKPYLRYTTDYKH